MKKYKISFLLGSGISIYANAPDTSKITDSILKDENIIQKIPSFSYTEHRLSNQQIVCLIHDFLNHLKFRIIKYYEWLDKRNLKNFNYEIIYYIIWQLLNCGNGNYDNAAVYSLYKKMQRYLIPEFNKIGKNISGKKDFNIFLGAIVKYIEEIVCQKLRIKLEGKSKFLKVILEAYKDSRIKGLDIFTLNHDTLIEQCLERNKIQYTDGFEECKGFKKWNPDTFEKNKSLINLYKLHGSVDWYPFRDNGKWVFGKEYNYEKTDDKKNGKVMKDDSHRHLLLIGTFNKVYDYLLDIHLELHYLFYKKLMSSDFLIISGYSLSDKFINYRISRFLVDHPEKVLIIHNKPEKLRKNAREAIIDALDRSRLVNMINDTIEKKFEKVHFEEIMGKIQELEKSGK